MRDQSYVKVDICRQYWETGTPAWTSLAQLIERAPALALLPHTLEPAQGPSPASARKRPRGRPLIEEQAEAAGGAGAGERGGDAAGRAGAGCRLRRGRRGGGLRAAPRGGVSVLCGRGALAAVTLRLSTSPETSRAVRLEGRFDVLSLSGTVLPAAVEARARLQHRSRCRSRGRRAGGRRHGRREMTAADGGVVLVAATFVSAEVHRLPEAEAEAVVEEADGRQEQERRPATPPRRLLRRSRWWRRAPPTWVTSPPTAVFLAGPRRPSARLGTMRSMPSR
ncbi:hypothetical protein ZWY2020_026634 [Hordeum vulgare]|nr:hypothetical protein ZWY2020_026634 [Hordeum vulgare]